MPTDDSLGFTNRWYSDALATAENYEIKPGLQIRLLTPTYFIATKLEAWNGRGDNDYLASRDLEDILNLINGRDTLVEDMRISEKPVLRYIAAELGLLLAASDFDYSLQIATNGDSERMDYLVRRIQDLMGLAK